MKYLNRLIFSFLFVLLSFSNCFAQEKLTISELLKIIADSKNKQVIMINFYASWCPPCRTEIPSLIEIRKQFPEDKLKMLAINLDQDEETMIKFNKEFNINYDTYQDDGSIQQFYMVQGIPFTIIYGKSGKAVLATTGLVSKQDLIDAINYGSN